MAEGYSALPNQMVRAATGVDYGYRDTGEVARGSCRWSCSSISGEPSPTGIRR